MAREPHGAYPPRLAGALAGVGGNRLGQWARHALVRATVYAGPPANVYAFEDVASAIVVHWLRSRGFGYEEIHHAIEVAREGHPDWPLLDAPLGVARTPGGDDRGVIVQRFEDAWVETGRPGRQAILRPELLDFARDMLGAGGWPADRLGLERIEVDPRRMGGVPTLRGRRWAVERVARIAVDEGGRALLAEDHGLEEVEIDEAVRWAEAAAALHETGTDY